LSGATAIAQVISYCAIPLLTRLYSVEDYAILALFFSWLLPLVVLSTLRIEFSIPDASSDDESALRRNLALNVSLYFCCGIFIVMFLLWLLGIRFHNVFWFLPIAVLITAWSQVYNFYTTRTSQFKLNGIYRIVSNLGISIISIALGYFLFTGYGLILGFIAGQLISVFILVIFSKGELRWIDMLAMKFSLPHISRLRKHIIYNTPTGLIEVMQLSIIVFVLEKYFGSVATGSFYLCWRILQAPSSLISNTIFLSQYSAASELNRNGKQFSGMVTYTFILLLLTALPAMIILFFQGENLFRWVFGDMWAEAGGFASIMILYFGFSFAVSPFSYVPLIKEQQRKLLVLSSLDLILRCATFYFGAIHKDVELAIMLFSISGVVFCLINIAWYYRLASTIHDVSVSESK
jgi:O-antigen/teichoic acid export membrane protein